MCISLHQLVFTNLVQNSNELQKLRNRNMLSSLCVMLKIEIFMVYSPYTRTHLINSYYLHLSSINVFMLSISVEIINIYHYIPMFGQLFHVHILH